MSYRTFNRFVFIASMIGLFNVNTTSATIYVDIAPLGTTNFTRVF